MQKIVLKNNPPIFPVLIKIIYLQNFIRDFTKPVIMTELSKYMSKNYYLGHSDRKHIFGFESLR